MTAAKPTLAELLAELDALVDKIYQSGPPDAPRRRLPYAITYLMTPAELAALDREDPLWARYLDGDR